MVLVVLGVLLWSGAHLFKRVASGPREALGQAGRGIVALLVVLSVVLMVVGFRQAEFISVWEPPRFLTHVNNLLMLIAVYLFAADGLRAKAGIKMKNPQLSGFKAWALAHLLVNGDLASILLFGGLLAWAVVTVIVLKRQAVAKAPKVWGGPKAEVLAVIGAVVVYGVIGMIHGWVGPMPFGG